ncbi:hypothetical protein AB0A95_23525 [Micromonospora sp. NPDC049230]|uniref:hypothetical protein n=1 Tax=Micromonospora sp. NPDC049230 TaxID=3155502 RepID=UPI0033EFA806
MVRARDNGDDQETAAARMRLAGCAQRPGTRTSTLVVVALRLALVIEGSEATGR